MNFPAKLLIWLIMMMITKSEISNEIAKLKAISSQVSYIKISEGYKNSINAEISEAIEQLEFKKSRL